MMSNLSSGRGAPSPPPIAERALLAARTRARLAAVIVSYNTRDLLRRCLASLSLDGLPVEVLVVDNGSRDGSVEMLRREFPQVALLAPGANLGFAAGNNLGLRRLGLEQETSLDYDYVLLLNPDAELLPGALATLAAFLDDHPRVGMVAPQLRYPDGSHQAAAFRFPTLAMTLLDFFPPRGPLLGRLYASALNGRYPQDAGDEPFAIDHPLGAAMLVRASAIRQVGLFDQRYWLYVEEVDWCYRMRQAGWAIWQQPAAVALHASGGSSRQFRARSFLALQRSRLSFFQRFYPPSFLRWHRRLMRLAALRDLLSCAWQIARGHPAQDQRERMLAAVELLRLSSSSEF